MPRPKQLPVFLALIAVLVTRSVGQSPPAPEAPPEIQLDDFIVTAGTEEGWRANTAVSGTRMQVWLKDLPMNLAAITEGFMEDTLARSLEEATRFTSGVVDLTSGGQGAEGGAYIIRGMFTQRVKRNGFQILFAQDMTNVSRVEVIKGPASLLYGEAQPGGIVNYITKTPPWRNQFESETIIGTFGYKRQAFGAGGPLIRRRGDERPLLAYRFDASYTESDGWRSILDSERRFAAGVLEFNPGKATTLRLSIDRLADRSRMNPPQPLSNSDWAGAFRDDLPIPYRTVDPLTGAILDDPDGDGISGTVRPSELSLVEARSLGQEFPRANLLIERFRRGSTAFPTLTRIARSMNLAGTIENPEFLDSFASWDPQISQASQDNFNRNDNTVWFASLEHRFNEHLNLRVQANLSTPVNRRGWIHPISLRANGVITEGSGAFFDLANEDANYQFDLAAQWTTGPVKHRTLIGGEIVDWAHQRKSESFFRSREWFVDPRLADLVRHDPNNIYAAPAQVTADRNIGSPSAAFLEDDTTQGGIQFVREKTTGYGVYLTNIATMFDDRLLLMSGLRYDTSNQEFQPGTTGYNPLTASSVNDRWVPQVGVSWSPDRDQLVTLFVLSSESFAPERATGLKLNPAYNPRFIGPSGSLVLADPTLPYDPLTTTPLRRQPKIGTTQEFGVKVSLFGGRVSGSLSYFDIRFENFVTDIFLPAVREDPTTNADDAVRVDAPGAFQSSSGLELDCIIQASSSLEIALSASSIQTGLGFDPSVSGFTQAGSYPLPGVPQESFSSLAKYSFREGRLRGLAIGLGAVWQSDHLAVLAFGPEGRPRSEVYLDDSLAVDFFIQLRRRIMRDRVEATLALNAKNLSDEVTFIGNPSQTSSQLPRSPRELLVSLRLSW